MSPVSRTGLGLSAVLCSLVLVGCGDQTPSEPAAVPVGAPAALAPRYAAAKGIDGEVRYVVQFKARKGPDFDAVVRVAGGTVARDHPEIGTALVTGLSPAALARLKTRRDVEVVTTDLVAQWIPPASELIRSRSRLTAPAVLANRNDQSSAVLFDEFQWNLRKVSAPAAWRNTAAGKGVTVCVLDTGIDPGQIDIKGKVDRDLSRSFVASEPTINDRNFHGTFVSGIITSNGIGTASVAPAARLCALKVLDQTGSGSFADVIAGIVYAGANRVQVINMSLGALLDFNDPDQRALARAVQKAITYAHNQGTIVVAASGNQSLNLDESARIKSIPAQLDHVVSVGATGPINQRRFDRLASYSNYGQTGNDLVAPGGESIAGVTLPEFELQDLIVSPCSRFVCGDDGFVIFADGTSFASPHVAAAVAIAESQLAGDQSPDQLEACVETTADDIGLPVFFGAGRLDAFRTATCGPAA